jgi:uridine kinase
MTFNNSKLILIGGGTASGKTTISHQIKDAIERKGLSVLELEIDNYYLPEDDVPESSYIDGKIN